MRRYLGILNWEVLFFNFNFFRMQKKIVIMESSITNHCAQLLSRPNISWELAVVIAAISSVVTHKLSDKLSGH